MASFNKVRVKKLYLPDGNKKAPLGKSSQVTATASELNILDGVTATADEINQYCDASAFEASALQSAEHGAGAIGTAFAPRTYRWEREGHIITEIHVDLTGLACKGDAANDVIGLAAGDPAYIGRYVTSTCGIWYRAEVMCIETPGEGTATITTDIDIAFNSSATLEYDGAAGTAELNLGGVAAGNLYSDDTLALTANDYIYLVEGDTAATTGEYDAGQLIIRFYGHAVIS